MSRLIVFSDTHIHDYTTFSKPVKDRTIGSRAITCLDAVSQVLSLAKDSDYILFTGDLFDEGSKLRPSLLIEVIELLSSCGVDRDHLLFMPGQHDYEASDVMDNAVAVLIDTVTILWDGPNEFDDFNIVSVWHSKDMDHMIKMAHFGYERSEGSKPCFLAGHFLVDKMLEEAGMPLLKNAVPIERLPMFTASFIGDFHFAVNLKKYKMFSVGALLHKNFTDKNRPLGSCIIYDIESGDWVRHIIDAPRFQEMTVKEFEKKKGPKTDYYKLIIKDVKDLALKIIPLKEEGWNVVPGFDRKVLQKKSEDKSHVRLKSDITSPNVVITEWMDKIGKSQIKAHWSRGYEDILKEAEAL